MTAALTSFEWNPPSIRDTWAWDPEQIESWQLDVLNRQLASILPKNKFYAEKFGDVSLQLTSLEELAALPFTTKEELVESSAKSNAGLSSHHTFDASAYSRMHRTSGTTGNPMVILDTTEDWTRWSWTWQHVLEAARIESTDRVFLAFSFGPFIGFWSAHQACIDRGAMVIPGGGLSSLGRLDFMRQSETTVLCCTPSYALHLAEVAEAEGFSIADLAINRIIVAGEPGGSVIPVRKRIEELWQAKVIDHSGATEIGPWGFGWPDRPGLHIIETSFIAELVPLETQVEQEDLKELVITSLGRLGAPVFRYRTGDAVIANRPTDGECKFLWLPSGVVGRTDNMVTIRGINVFPSSIDAIVRKHADVSEYRVNVSRKEFLDQLDVEVEAPESCKAELEKSFSVHLGLRVPVHIVATGTLPRSELKSRRWQDLR